MIQVKNKWTGALIGEWANLREANLTGANLREADLTRADLTRADLRGANLTGANLTGANLTGANLTGANLTGANLRKADLREANLTGANLDFATWPLWCGSLAVTLDERLKVQLLYHCISVIGVEGFTAEQIARANSFHRVGELPRLKCKGVEP